MGNICTVINVEKGILEAFAILLLRSINEFGGKLASTDILCFQPRKSFPVSSRTKYQIKQLGGVFIDENINDDFKFYALANKPKVCSWVEDHCSYQQVFFFDTDTLVLNEPRQLWLTREEHVGVVPVYEKGIGVADAGDPNFRYWKRIYHLLGTDIEQVAYRTTTLKGEKILPYWNTAVTSAKADRDLFHHWQELTERTLVDFNLPVGGNYFVEESCFSALLVSRTNSIKNLSFSHNYPTYPGLLPSGFYNDFNMQNLTIVHHLNELPFFCSLMERFEDEKTKWISKQLKELRLKDYFSKIRFRYAALRQWTLEKGYYLPFRLNKGSKEE